MKNLALSLAMSAAISTVASAGLADTTETTTTTTVETTTAATSFVLPAGGTYVVVDPATGVSGIYDVTTRLFAGHPLPAGGYIIDQSNGKVLATVDASGTLIGFSTIPTTLPSHFVVINGTLMYFPSDYDLRRAQIGAEIDVDYAKGKLSNRQVQDLRERLAEVAALSAKRRDDGTYNSSTAKSIERKLAYIQSDLARDVADINGKRARIGLKVD